MNYATMTPLQQLAHRLIKTKEYADTGKPLFCNQGQSLDGYSELAEYRATIEVIKELFFEEGVYTDTAEPESRGMTMTEVVRDVLWHLNHGWKQVKK